MTENKYEEYNVKDISDLDYGIINDMTDEDLLTILTKFEMNKIPLIEYDNSFNQIIMFNLHQTVWYIFNEVRVMRQITRKTVKIPVTYSQEEIETMSIEQLEEFVNNSDCLLGTKMNQIPLDLFTARLILSEKQGVEKFREILDK